MGYGEAPWTFKGRALYQLQLVKADEARKHIPPELKLVELFGYTLGGVYLARYDDSPAGSFDECVAMAGLVWNPPTSCAWAARVFVDSAEARAHGIAAVGLPSRLARFEQLRASSRASHAWWAGGAAAAGAAGAAREGEGEAVRLLNVDRGRRGLPHRPVAEFELPTVPVSGFRGPRLRLSLPSFSGGTAEHPGLLQYCCDLSTSVMAVAPMRVQLQPPAPQGGPDDSGSGSGSGGGGRPDRQGVQRQRPPQRHPEVLDLLLGGRPLVCLAFSDMVMRVEEPRRLPAPEPGPAGRKAAAAPYGAPALAAVLPRK